MAASEERKKDGYKTPPDSSKGRNIPPPLNGKSPPSQLVGQKRKRSRSRDSSQDQPCPSDRAERECPSPPKQLVSRCSTCGLPCWGCYSAKKSVKRVGEIAAEQGGDMPEGQEQQSMNPPTAPASSAYVPESSQSFEQSIGSKRSSNKRKKCEERGLVYIGPKDENFQDYILARCGFVFDYYISPDSTPEEVYKAVSPTPQSRVFLEKSGAELQSIIEDFTELKLRKYDEHTLTTVCQDSIVLRDYFHKISLLTEDSREIRSVRRDKWRPNLEGPKIPGNICVFDWDIEPDTTYGVSINMFGVSHRRALRIQKHLLADCASASPYLTLEYKSSEKTGKESDAISQVAAASILWLYRRNCARDAAQTHASASAPASAGDLRHYAITILDADYAIRETRLEQGSYVMRTLASGDLTRLDDLKRYLKWNNAIHAWGLGPNATSFRDDVVKLLGPEAAA